MKNIEEIKDFIRNANQAHSVKELVEFGWELEPALNWVYDMLTLTNEEFVAKRYPFLNTTTKKARKRAAR